jgi:hypothetical protein
VDPHVHAPASLVGPGRLREALTAVVGRGVSMPATVHTSCGQRRPLAEMSSRPEAVTCLACRETAARRHRDWADQLAMIAGTPFGAPGDTEWAWSERDRHADLARRYAGPR